MIRSYAKKGFATSCLALIGGLFFAPEAAAFIDLPAMTVTTGEDGSENYSISIQILAVMTILTLLPSLVIMLTAFTRIVIVFAILRQAIGMQQTPSNQILVGIALFLTIFVMAPVFQCWSLAVESLGLPEFAADLF